MTALLLVASNGFTDLVNLLIAAGADLNVRNDEVRLSLYLWSVLLIGAFSPFVLLQSDTALMLAASNGFAEVVSALISAGADIHAQNRTVSFVFVGVLTTAFRYPVSLFVRATRP
jgi:ankyrin repeat protein